MSTRGNLMENNKIFRDTKNWYLTIEPCASLESINFVTRHAGEKILDLGCATGGYCNNLNNLGFKCTGVDINSKYVEKARQNGIEAYTMEANDLKFPDDSFDTVLLFEILEHVDKPSEILKESKRVAKKNILITVPNCTQFFELKSSGLTYEHVLEKDHVNFFTKKDLENLISKEFKTFKVIEDDPINLNQLSLITGLPLWLRLQISLFNKLKFIKPSLYYHLYAVVNL
jgi:2-polyprenyl-3-methyl-5-hydroxy-6-metoxy-1,4-benzoquinol methylase